MRTSLPVTIALAVITATSAFAQSASPARTTTAPPAVSNPNDTAKTTAAPVAGKNSFTESEARSRIEKQGYTQVSALMKDDQSIWHAKAAKNGQPVNVTVDYQGNVTAN